MHDESLIILLVEDNFDHAELIMRGLEDHRVINQIHHVADGEAALNYLFQRDEYADPKKSPRPHLVLLDLRLPKIDGLEVLKEVKTSETLRAIPVVILTSSSAQNDVTRAYEYHANSYLVKPVDFDQFKRLMNHLGYYWLVWNQKRS